MRPRASATRRAAFALREVRPADLDALAALDARCFEPGIAFTRGQIASFLDLDTREGIVAESRGRLLGFAIGYLRRPALGGVLTIDVEERSRRAGVGRGLLAELLGRLEGAGAETIRLEVDVRNAGALAFYRSFGFRRVGRIPDYYGDGLDGWEMERGTRSLSDRLSVRSGRGSARRRGRGSSRRTPGSAK